MVEPACFFFFLSSFFFVVVVVEVERVFNFNRIRVLFSHRFLCPQTRLHFRFPYDPPSTEQGTGREHPEGCSDPGRGLEGHFR